jgi:hypothetical protein
MIYWNFGRLRLKCDGNRAETIFPLPAKWTRPFNSVGGGRHQFSRLLAAEVCASAVVMLDTPCSEVVWRVLDTHSIRQFPLHFPSHASPCAITFQLESTLLTSLCPYRKAEQWPDTFLHVPFKDLYFIAALRSATQCLTQLSLLRLLNSNIPYTVFEMWWHTRRNQISCFGATVRVHLTFWHRSFTFKF